MTRLVIAGDFNKKSFRKVCEDNARLRNLLEEWNDLAQHQGLSTQAHRNRTAAALATPLTAAVEAVEGMRKALELSVPFLDHDSPRDLSSLKCTESCVRCKVSAALAAYEEATRG